MQSNFWQALSKKTINLVALPGRIKECPSVWANGFDIILNGLWTLKFHRAGSADDEDVVNDRQTNFWAPMVQKRVER